jgi:RimJ/RimL family protein N-acetyltransferase
MSDRLLARLVGVIDCFETDRLRLRPVTLRDVDDLVVLDRDPEVMRFINGGRPTPPEEVEATVRSSLGHRWVATERGTNRFVGWFSLRPTGGSEHELGYRLHREFWGKGLATEGSRALVAKGFTELDSHRIWAQTMTVNTASRRVLERCGLRYVRTFHLDWPEPIEGTELGDVEYEILKPDWEAKRAGSSRRGKIFYLVEAPDAETAHTVHRETHGLVADEIYEVNEG